MALRGTSSALTSSTCANAPRYDVPAGARRQNLGVLNCCDWPISLTSNTCNFCLFNRSDDCTDCNICCGQELRTILHEKLAMRENQMLGQMLFGAKILVAAIPAISHSAVGSRATKALFATQIIAARNHAHKQVHVTNKVRTCCHHQISVILAEKLDTISTKHFNIDTLISLWYSNLEVIFYNT